MAVRSLITAGAAFATAGMVAVVPAIAPPLAPRDIRVIQQTEARVQLAAQLTLQDLINVFFGVTPAGSYVDPGGPDAPPLPPVTDAAGTFGLSGVIYQLLHQQQGAYLPGTAGLEAFFNGGVTDYIELALLSQSADPAQRVIIEAFFDGLSQLAYEYLQSGTTDSETTTYLRTFFNQGGFDNPALFGAPGVIYLRLLAGFQAPEQQAFINNLFQGGFSQVAYQQLGGDLGAVDEEGEPLPTSTPYLSAFFGINNNVIDPDGSGSPSLTGVSGVVYTRLKAAEAAGDLTPEQMSVIDPFFNGGLAEVVRVQLLSRTSDLNQQNLINEFFDNGISGVVRYLLVGPAPAPPPEEAPEENLRTAFVAEPTEQDAVRAADTSPAPEAEPAAAPAATTPAEENEPVFTAKIREESVAEESADEVDDGGANKTEPEIVLGTGGPKPGSGSWGIFGQIAQSVHDAVANAGKPATPAGDVTGDSGDGGAEG